MDKSKNLASNSTPWNILDTDLQLAGSYYQRVKLSNPGIIKHLQQSLKESIASDNRRSYEELFDAKWTLYACETKDDVFNAVERKATTLVMDHTFQDIGDAIDAIDPARMGYRAIREHFRF